MTTELPDTNNPATADTPLALVSSDVLGPHALHPLKACPFCGKAHTLKLTTAQELAEQDSNYDGEFWEHSDSWAVMCDASRPGGPGGCGASGGFFPTEHDAVKAWNLRA